MSQATSQAPPGRPSRRAPRPVRAVARAVHGTVMGVRRAVRAAVAGDRPLVVVLLVVLGLSVVLLSGPMQSYLAARDRVNVLQAQDEALQQDLARLEQEREDLLDPAQIELRAREDGYVYPGEVPWQVVPPEQDRPLIVDPPAAVDPEPDPWWVRAWRGVTSIFGG